MTGIRYVPILKGKAGEMDALRDCGLATRRTMFPLVEAVPPDDTSDLTAAEKALSTLTTRLAPRFSDPIQFDVGLFDLTVPVDGTRSAVGVLMDLARSESIVAQPVVRIGDPPIAIADVAEACKLDRRGITIRLLGDELDEEPADLDDAFDDLLASVGVSRSEADLLIDLGAVEGDVAVRGGARMVISLMRDLPSIHDWRTVTVASGAFPVDLSQFSANVIGERPRYDAQLFDAVTRKTTPRQPDYGDYAIAHPLLTTGAPFSPPPQLRYTVSDRWLVLKGRRNDPLGNSQFQRICTIIAAHPEFAGAPCGLADARIAAGSPDGVGNGTTWRAVGTNHHLDYVVRRLTTLGEP